MRFIILLALFLLFSCKKIVSVNPPDTELSGSTVFNNEATAIGAVTGIYSRMITDDGFASGSTNSIAFLSGLSADELKNYGSENAKQFYLNNIDPSNSQLEYKLWNQAYQYIYSANAVIEGLQKSSSISDSIRFELTGEAKFIRAFFHFYLVNLWGEVPLVTTTNYIENNRALKSSLKSIYAQIERDLLSADSLLSNQYIGTGNKVSLERIRPNKYAAKALLARTFLFKGEYQKAINSATEIIDQSGIYSLVSKLNSVFLKNSTEAIWQLYPSISGMNTMEGRIFITPNGQIPVSATVTDNLLESFENNDARRTSWIGKSTYNGVNYFFPYKYKVGLSSEILEYSMVLRLAEVYLIRAEAAVRNGLPDIAISDINTIRNRAGLSSVDPLISESDLIKMILHEKRIELFSEWGHRWLDLKRTKTADETLSLLKQETWKATDTLYPIPQAEILINPNLSQNPGY